MYTRPFTVFQDDTATVIGGPLAVLAAEIPAVTPLGLVPASPSIEKENVNPITGHRSGLNGEAPIKKRKTGVLATKSVVLPGSTSPTSKLALKKRAVSSPSKPKRGPALQRSVSNPLPVSPSKSSAVFGGNSQQNTSEMKAIQEQDDMIVATALALEDFGMGEGSLMAYDAEALINSRIYELTVSPLADVSAAYDQSAASTPSPSPSPSPTLSQSSIDDVFFFGPATSLKKPLKDDVLRDPFTGTILGPAPMTTFNPIEFNTPERKHIMSAFTFTSPTRNSELYTADRFPDVEFRPF